MVDIIPPPIIIGNGLGLRPIRNRKPHERFHLLTSYFCPLTILLLTLWLCHTGGPEDWMRNRLLWLSEEGRRNIMATSDLERKVETTPVKTSIIDAIVNRKVIIRRSE